MLTITGYTTPAAYTYVPCTLPDQLKITTPLYSYTKLSITGRLYWSKSIYTYMYMYMYMHKVVYPHSTCITFTCTYLVRESANISGELRVWWELADVVYQVLNHLEMTLKGSTSVHVHTCTCSSITNLLMRSQIAFWVYTTTTFLRNTWQHPKKLHPPTHPPTHPPPHTHTQPRPQTTPRFFNVGREKQEGLGDKTTWH